MHSVCVRVCAAQGIFCIFVSFCRVQNVARGRLLNLIARTFHTFLGPLFGHWIPSSHHIILHIPLYGSRADHWFHWPLIVYFHLTNAATTTTTIATISSFSMAAVVFTSFPSTFGAKFYAKLESSLFFLTPRISVGSILSVLPYLKRLSPSSALLHINSGQVRRPFIFFSSSSSFASHTFERFLSGFSDVCVCSLHFIIANLEH